MDYCRPSKEEANSAMHSCTIDDIICFARAFSLSPSLSLSLPPSFALLLSPLPAASLSPCILRETCARYRASRRPRELTYKVVVEAVADDNAVLGHELLDGVLGGLDRVEAVLRRKITLLDPRDGSAQVRHNTIRRVHCTHNTPMRQCNNRGAAEYE